jgi:hypothetical protein
MNPKGMDRGVPGENPRTTAADSRLNPPAKACCDRRVLQTPAASGQLRFINSMTCERDGSMGKGDFPPTTQGNREHSGRMFPTRSEVSEGFSSPGHTKTNPLPTPSSPGTTPRSMPGILVTRARAIAPQITKWVERESVSWSLWPGERMHYEYDSGEGRDTVLEALRRIFGWTIAEPVNW